MAKKKKKNGSKGRGAKGKKLDRIFYEKELERLQAELCKMQEWVKAKKHKMIVVFEGRDAAGKGGVIKRITERVSPRVFRVVALPAPTERQKTQLYMQRYFRHFPAGGEVVIFDRSWYNRAGVERVMGFCTDDEYEHFIRNISQSELYFVDQGIQLIKYYLTVTNKEQEKRFMARINDPRKHWKLSPMDLESRRRWYSYSRARDAMLLASDSKHAPWHIVRSDDKRRARLNCIRHLLSMVPYKKVAFDKPKLPKRDTSDTYADEKALEARTFIPELY